MFFLGQTQRYCSFDNGLCGFVNDQSGTDDFDWIRLRDAAESVTRFRITRIWRPRRPFRPFYGMQYDIDLITN
jgi:hypothetical protein